MTNLYVGNLNFQTTEQDLNSLFSQYGAVERVNIVTDRMTGQPRGFAFVEMTNKNEADQAISSLDGREFDGRSITVNEARPKTDGPRGGGGGNRGGGGGYGGGRSGNRGGGGGYGKRY
jgi:cold-inducible RNA-binding protein